MANNVASQDIQMYAYLPLQKASQEIRIMRLEPSEEFESDIHCHLVVTDIKQASHEQYLALSYVWGDEASPRTIYVDNAPLLVTRNLYTALKYLRAGDQPWKFWIDAVCINQADVSERNHQVSIMHQVYAAAERVLVWLGESTPEEEDALKFYQDGENDPCNTRFRGPYQGLKTLFERPWWSRIWVVPEVHLAKEEPVIGCGHAWAHLENIIRCRMRLVVLEQYDENGRPPARSPEVSVLQSKMFLLQSCRSREEQKDKERLDNTFAVLLHGTSRRNCKNPRDKIFAVLSMTSEDVRDNFRIDYSEPVNTVYQRAMAVALVDAKLQFDLLPFAISAKDPSLPSWCVDFSTTDWADLDQMDQKWPKLQLDPRSKAQRRRYRRRVPARKPELDVERSAIGLEGLPLGKVTSCVRLNLDLDLKACDRMNEAEQEVENDRLRRLGAAFVPKMLDFNRRAIQTLASRLGYEEACKAIAKGATWRTYYGGAESYLHAWPRELFQSYHGGYGVLEAFAVECVPEWSIEAHDWSSYVPAIPEGWNTVSERIIENQAFQVHDCTLFCTDTGYIGRVVDPIEEGDALALLFGTQYPAVLKPKGDAFELKTFAWVDDVVDDGPMEKKLYGALDFIEQRKFWLV